MYVFYYLNTKKKMLVPSLCLPPQLTLYSPGGDGTCLFLRDKNCSPHPRSWEKLAPSRLAGCWWNGALHWHWGTESEGWAEAAVWVGRAEWHHKVQVTCSNPALWHGISTWRKLLEHRKPENYLDPFERMAFIVIWNNICLAYFYLQYMYTVYTVYAFKHYSIV